MATARSIRRHVAFFFLLSVVAAGVVSLPAVAAREGDDENSAEGSTVGGASSPSSCLRSGEILTEATGVITDGSGPIGDYLANTNCTWIVRPSTAGGTGSGGGSGNGSGDGGKNNNKKNTTAATSTSPPSAEVQPGRRGITLVFEEFKTVFDDDFLFITDASEDSDNDNGGSDGDATADASSSASSSSSSSSTSAAPHVVGRELGLYSGMLPTPMAVRFDDVAALRLNFVTRGNNRDGGFVVRYIADGTCYNDCDGGRRAASAARLAGGGGEGSGDIGAEAGDDDETGTGECHEGLCVCDEGWIGADCSVRLEPLGTTNGGETVSGTVDVGQTRYYRVEVPSSPPDLMLKVELEFPDGGNSNGARPLLMIANASSSSSLSSGGTFFDEFYTKNEGDCGSYPG